MALLFQHVNHLQFGSASALEDASEVVTNTASWTTLADGERIWQGSSTIDVDDDASIFWFFQSSGETVIFFPIPVPTFVLKIRLYDDTNTATLFEHQLGPGVDVQQGGSVMPAGEARLLLQYNTSSVPSSGPHFATWAGSRLYSATIR